jgi:hypothetical protein
MKNSSCSSFELSQSLLEAPFRSNTVHHLHTKREKIYNDMKKYKKKQRGTVTLSLSYFINLYDRFHKVQTVKGNWRHPHIVYRLQHCPLDITFLIPINNGGFQSILVPLPPGNIANICLSI